VRVRRNGGSSDPHRPRALRKYTGAASVGDCMGPSFRLPSKRNGGPARELRQARSLRKAFRNGRSYRNNHLTAAR
jgi:hypothetical protein